MVHADVALQSTRKPTDQMTSSRQMNIPLNNTQYNKEQFTTEKERETERERKREGERERKKEREKEIERERERKREKKKERERYVGETPHLYRPEYN